MHCPGYGRARTGREIGRHEDFKYIQTINYRAPIVHRFPDFFDETPHRVE